MPGGAVSASGDPCHDADMQIADHITDLIGNTPLVRLSSVAPAEGALVAAKVEYLNPGGSIKDRTALGLIEDAERRFRETYLGRRLRRR